jgi:hypothetical protein
MFDPPCKDPAADEELYLPLSQRPWLVAKLLVRTNNPAGMAATIRNRIQTVDPSQAVADSVPLQQVVSDRLGRPRTAMLVVAMFAGSALLLAPVGIYGVIAYSVAQRRKEIGIRMALGPILTASRQWCFGRRFDYLSLAAPRFTSCNNAQRLYTSLLFEVKAGDPTTFACVIGLLFSVALAASYLPAIRAANVDPVVVLRMD